MPGHREGVAAFRFRWRRSFPVRRLVAFGSAHFLQKRKPRMKCLLAASPIPGHLNPILSIGRLLASRGHEVVFTTASVFRERVEQTGARFIPFLAGADLDLRDIDAAFPERKNLPVVEMLRFSLERMFFDAMPHQYESLQHVLGDFDADVVIADNFCFGTLPLLLGNRSARPPVVHYGFSILQYRRDDGAPFHAGYPPARNAQDRESYIRPRVQVEEALLKPLHRHVNMRLRQAGSPELGMNVFDATIALPELFLQSTVAGFEYPRRSLPDTVHFVGVLEPQADRAALPEWAHELDGSKHVVLVTQGTLANADLGQLIAPTLAAVADDPDILVIATTGGRAVESIPGVIPANARIAPYLPFDWLLGNVDVVVTNGGYGTVNLALKRGIPLVVSGLTEDKAEVSARVAWSGTGINLQTGSPTVEALRSAIHAVLGAPAFRNAVRRMADQFSAIDTEATVLELIENVVRRED